MKENKLFKPVLSALFLALAYVMPFLTGQVPEIGSAYTCDPLRLCLRVAVGSYCRFHRAAFSFSHARYASPFPNGRMYGF